MKIKNSIFLTKFTGYGKNVETKLFIPKRSTTLVLNIFYGSYTFCLLMKNIMKYEKLFLRKTLRGVQKKCWGKNCSSQEDSYSFITGTARSTTKSCFKN